MLGSPDRELALPASPAPHGVLANLRRALALEFPQITADKSALAFGIPSLDAALGGGLATGALHEIAAAREAEIPAATGFALILAARNRGPVVWIAEDMALAENGAPYGAGLEDLGLAPERLTAGRAAKSRWRAVPVRRGFASASPATVAVRSEHGCWSSIVWNSVAMRQRIVSLWLKRLSTDRVRRSPSHRTRVFPGSAIMNRSTSETSDVDRGGGSPPKAAGWGDLASPPPGSRLRHSPTSPLQGE